VKCQRRYCNFDRLLEECMIQKFSHRFRDLLSIELVKDFIASQLFLIQKVKYPWGCWKFTVAVFLLLLQRMEMR
jgi:hypothetical protein